MINVSKTRYVVIEESNKDIYCLGICDDYETAVGKAYLEAIDFINNTFDNCGDATLQKLSELEAENGDVLSVTWEEDGKTMHRDFYILENESEETL